MSSIMGSLEKKRSFFPLTDRDTLPVSSGEKPTAGMLRRRLSSMSLNLHPISSPSSWSLKFPRSKSVSSMGEQAGSSLREWWSRGWSWILSRKPIFARDVEMNKEEARVLGSHNRGSLMHVFFKVRSEIRRLLGSGNDSDLPLSCRYDGSVGGRFRG